MASLSVLPVVVACPVVSTLEVTSIPVVVSNGQATYVLVPGTMFNVSTVGRVKPCCW